MRKNKLIILGFGGHARSVADIALSLGYKKLLFIDPNAKPNEFFLDHPVCCNFESIDLAEWDIFPAAGDNQLRSQQVSFIKKLDKNLVSLVAPSCTVGISSTLGECCFIANHVHIGPMATIGDGVILNTSSVVDHESKVGNFVHVSVNASIAGRSSIGDFSMIGVGASIIDRISIPPFTIIGAGATVSRSIESSGTYVGVPAKAIK